MFIKLSFNTIKKLEILFWGNTIIISISGVFLALLLVFLNGFFVAAEFSLVKLRYTQAQEIQRLGGIRSRVLFTVHQNLDSYLSACQLGITFASLGLGWIGEPAFATVLKPLFVIVGVFSTETQHFLSLLIAFTLISFLHIVVGELMPKSIAIRQPGKMSLMTAVPLFIFYGYAVDWHGY